jgi:EpsI family protein
MDLKKNSFAIWVVASVSLAVLAVAGNYLRFSAPPPAGALGIDSYRLGDATYEVEPMDTRFLDLLGAREVSFRTYGGGAEDRVWVFLGYFDRQKEGSQVHSPKHCYPGSGWNITDESTVAAPWWRGKIKRLIVTNGDEQRLVYYWFQTSDRILSDVFALKYHLTVRAILRHPQDVVFARVSTGWPSGTNAPDELLKQYSSRVETAIGALYANRDGS